MALRKSWKTELVDTRRFACRDSLLWSVRRNQQNSCRRHRHRLSRLRAALWVLESKDKSHPPRRLSTQFCREDYGFLRGWLTILAIRPKHSRSLRTCAVALGLPLRQRRLTCSLWYSSASCDFYCPHSPFYSTTHLSLSLYAGSIVQVDLSSEKRHESPNLLQFFRKNRAA